MQASSVTRRHFLRATVIATAGLGLAACGQAAPPPAASSATAATSAPAAASGATSPKPAAASGAPAATPAGSAKPAAGAAKPSLTKVTILFNAPHEPDFVPDLAGYKAL